MYRRARLPFLLFAAFAVVLLGTSCSPGDPDLFVELKTDLIVGAEFSRVRTVVVPAGGGGSREQDAPAIVGTDYLSGQRIGEFTALGLGDYAVRVELFGLDGRQFIERTIRVNFRQSSGVVAVITRSCRGVTCPAVDGDIALSECLGGRCVDPACAQGDEDACGEVQCDTVADCPVPDPCAAAVCESGVCFARALLDGCGDGEYCDASTGCLPLPTVTDAGPPDGSMDAGDAADTGPAGCTADGECDDGLDCTADSCDAGTCVNTGDDSACTAGTGGLCIEGFGCQYDGCSPSTCVAGACEVARCDGDTCVIDSACTASEMCCGGSCVALGCEDGDVCTDDSCGAAGCLNTPNSEVCDDGTFCNGPDTCGGGTCSVHAGDPCSGGSSCNEPTDTCVGCLTDGDCPADIVGPWGACGGFGNTCDETGTRSRTITSYSCSGSTCVGSDRTDTGACSRTTGGLSCGTTTFSAWGACGGFSSTCDTTGSRTRSRTSYTCSGGSCNSSTTPDPGSCSRSTTGTVCSATTYGAWGACGSYSGTCDETGTRSRTQTDYACSSGSCSGSGSSDTGICSRDTDGTGCGMTTYGAWGSCSGYTSTCDETGTRTRTQTDRVCTTGSCTNQNSPDVGSCTRNTDGNGCSNWPGGCRIGNCNGGSCAYSNSECNFPRTCCEPGICVCDGCSCP